MIKQIVFLFCISLLIFSCKSSSHILKLKDGRTLDSRLVGNWKGSEKNQEYEGLEKKWTMERTEDGKFILHFESKLYGIVDKYTDTGTWYTIGDKFFEYHDSSKLTDVYIYQILDDNNVKFSALQMAHETNAEIYEFIDSRID